MLPAATRPTVGTDNARPAPTLYLAFELGNRDWKLGFTTKGRGVRASFERAFRDYGLPRAIRTDNGVPFATTGIHGLSQLNVWWMRLGIQHQRIRPASPQENAAHERMHKTLKAGAIRPPRGSITAQQRAFNSFRREYNDRSEERRVGKECRSRWTPYHKKKKTTTVNAIAQSVTQRTRDVSYIDVISQLRKSPLAYVVTACATCRHETTLHMSTHNLARTD